MSSSVTIKRSRATLTIEVETPRCIIRSLQAKDKSALAALWKDPNIMQKVEEGEALNNEKIDFRFNLFLSRWKKGDPFTAYSILDKENHYIGYICLGQPGPAGTAEIAYIIHPRFQGQGFGTEIIKAIMGSLVPELTAANHQVNGKTFDTVVATARTDNPASAKMLLHSGFIRDKTDEKYGAERLHLRFPLKKLLSFLQRDANDGAEISAFAMASSPFGRRRL